ICPFFPSWARQAGRVGHTPERGRGRAMKIHFVLLACSLLVGAAMLGQVPGGKVQPPAEQIQPGSEGQEGLARGPGHEAFAEPVTSQPPPMPIVPKKPPEAIEEMPPDQKPAGDNVVWIPGYWSWDDDRADFLWVSGLWRDMPPGRHWLPG